MQPESRPSPAFTPRHIRVMGGGVAMLLLALPVITMLARGGVNWGTGHFLTAAFLLAATGLAIEVIVRISKTPLALFRPGHGGDGVGDYLGSVGGGRCRVRRRL